jgi:hypothetical protein
MPRLRSYTDGSGFYIKDYLHGTGHCTWQVGEQALRFLRDRGVAHDGDHISGSDRNRLLEQDLIWRSGEGDRVGGVDGQGAAMPPEVAALAAELRGWAPQGGLAKLTPILYSSCRDHRDRCFSRPFLGWLERLDESLCLADLDRLSATDFDDIACPRLEQLEDVLHQHFAVRGETHVLWQLARVVGLVARQLRGNAVCPAAWTGGQPVLHRLFAILTQARGDVKTSLPASELPRRRAVRRLLARPPILRWEVDAQQVVIVLPEQQLPAEVEGLTWVVSPGGCEQPQIRLGSRGRFLEESCSHPLVPAASYSAEVTLRQPPPGGPARESSRWSLPAGLESCVLFDPDGTVLLCEDGVQFRAGEFLALVRVELCSTLLKKKGVQALERVPVGPAGWRGWEGWRLRLDGGAAIGPYTVEDRQATAGWDVEAPPPFPVRWRESHPVWVGAWPRLYLSSPDPFIGAVLEVTREDCGLVGTRPHCFRVGEDVPFAVDSATRRSFLSLAAVPGLSGVFGSLRLECRLPMASDEPPLCARLVRVPALAMRYVPDPSATELALAVEIKGCGQMVGSMTSEADTEIVRTGACVILRACQPVSSPGVTARLAEIQLTLRLRVPSGRACLITPERGFSGWRRLPVEDLDLSSVGVQDRLRVELHEPPITEAGRLFCRIVGGGEVAAGEALQALGPVHAFEVELHRWRDSLGFLAEGTIQLRGQRHWIDLARLRNRTATAMPAPTALGRRGQLLQTLDASLSDGDEKEAVRLASECLEVAGRPQGNVVDQELLPIAAARALIAGAGEKKALQRAADCLAGLAERTDLPDARLLRETAVLRLAGRVPTHEPMSRERLQHFEEQLPECSRKAFFLAECYYQFARDAHGVVEACWRSCLEFANFSLDGLSAATAVPEREEAELLRELARLMLGLEPSAGLSGPPAASEPSGRRHAWREAARFASVYVRTPITRPVTVPRAAKGIRSTAAPSVLRLEDENLLRFVVAQACRLKEASELARVLRPWGTETFFAIRLLEARQALLDGHQDEARNKYGALLQQAIANGPDYFLELVAAERPA